MTKMEARVPAEKAKWEAPVLAVVEADLNSVEASFSPGTDSLMFGGSSSQS